MAGDTAESEAQVKKALESFLRQHGGEASLSFIDEIVLSYMVSVLEELASGDTGEDVFDVEAFTDMMKEFMPEFADIDSTIITEWMFDLASKLSGKPQNGAVSVLSFCPPQSEAIAIDKPGSNKPDKRVHTVSCSSTNSLTEASSCTNSLTESRSASVAASSSSVEDVDGGGCCGGLGLLTEMFPWACRLEVSHCLGMAEGDVERAAQLLLHRQESAEAITLDDHVQPIQLNGKKQTLLNDEDMKKHIVNKYSFVDTEEDKRDHRPTLPKKDSKKLVRYLDSRVVSTKGERFTEIKKSPEEEEKMKKTFVSIKPAKLYRFH